MQNSVKRRHHIFYLALFPRRLIWTILCSIAASMVFYTCVYALDFVRSGGDSEDHIVEIFPYPLETMHERISLLFDSDKRDFYDDYPGAIYDLPGGARSVSDLTAGQYQQFLSHPLVKPAKFYVFFGAYPKMQPVLSQLDVLAAMGHDNAGLQYYANLPAAARADDFYLWSPDVPFWHSEYSLDGRFLPFRSYFIIHLEAVDTGHTKVEVIENQPVVALLYTPNVDAHGVLSDTKLVEVEPTNHEREFLLSCIGQFIERKIPGRHWFNCREKGEKVEEVIPWTVP